MKRCLNGVPLALSNHNDRFAPGPGDNGFLAVFDNLVHFTGEPVSRICVCHDVHAGPSSSSVLSTM